MPTEQTMAATQHLPPNVSQVRERTERLFATFMLDEVEFAIDVNHVEDAVPLPERIVPIPSAPAYILGMIHLRDRIVPVINTRRRFQMPANQEIPPVGYVAITCCQGHYLGLCFDRIREVIRMGIEALETLPAIYQNEGNLLSGVLKINGGERLVQIIDPLCLYDFEQLPAPIRQLTAADKTGADTSASSQAVVFAIGEELFGVDVDQVREIITVPEIQQRVLVEAYIRGLITLREEVLSVVDLRTYLGEATIPITEEHRIVILRGHRLDFGILVERVTEVLTYTNDHIHPMPYLTGNRYDGGFLGVLAHADTKVVLMDMAALFRGALERIEGHRRVNNQAKHTENDFQDDVRPAEDRQRTARTYITFDIGEIYGVDISHVREVVPINGNLHHLPGQVDFVQGILSLRSEVIPIINPRRYMGRDVSTGNEALAMILTRNDHQVGILIDRLREIVNLSDNGHNNVPRIIAMQQEKLRHEYIERVVELEDRQEGRIPVMILNIAAFMAGLDGIQGETTQNDPMP